jgi:hypothetical protein
MVCSWCGWARPAAKVELTDGERDQFVKVDGKSDHAGASLLLAEADEVGKIESRLGSGSESGLLSELIEGSAVVAGGDAPPSPILPTTLDEQPPSDELFDNGSLVFDHMGRRPLAGSIAAGDSYPWPPPGTARAT